MAKKGNTNKTQLKKNWRQANEALADLADLRVWPIGKDIAQLERELLDQLSVIEYQLGQDFLR